MQIGLGAGTVLVGVASAPASGSSGSTQSVWVSMWAQSKRPVLANSNAALRGIMVTEFHQTLNPKWRLALSKHTARTKPAKGSKSSGSSPRSASEPMRLQKIRRKYSWRV